MQHSQYHPLYLTAIGTSSLIDERSKFGSSSPEAKLFYQPIYQPWALEPTMDLSSFQYPSLELWCPPASEHLLFGAQLKSSEATSFSLYNPHPNLPHLRSPSFSTDLAEATVSAASTNMPYNSLPLGGLSPPGKLEMNIEEPTANADKDEDTHADLPYSQLIFAALHAAPGNKLPLQGIYAWFEENTAKGKDRSWKGWQNSIRHNLSMNAVSSLSSTLNCLLTYLTRALKLFGKNLRQERWQ